LDSLKKPNKRSIFGRIAAPSKIDNEETSDGDTDQIWRAFDADVALCRGQRMRIALDRNKGIERNERQGPTLFISDCKSLYPMDYFNPGIPFSVYAIPF
jgi:hypothetical protein